jgi:hypothetical protein
MKKLIFSLAIVASLAIVETSQARHVGVNRAVFRGGFVGGSFGYRNRFIFANNCYTPVASVVYAAPAVIEATAVVQAAPVVAAAPVYQAPIVQAVPVIYAQPILLYATPVYSTFYGGGCYGAGFGGFGYGGGFRGRFR